LEALTLDLNEQDLKSSGKSRLMSMQGESSQSIGQTFQSMETSEPLTGQQLNLLTSSVEGSHAKTYLMLESEQGLMGNDQDYGLNTSEPFAHLDLDSSLWRMFQGSLLTLTWDEYLENWPRAGLMQNGIAYQLPALEPSTGGIGCSSWPTPRTAMARTFMLEPMATWKRQTEEATFWNLEDELYSHACQLGLNLTNLCVSPRWVEWMMGYPENWTQL
jgi:hypothetical protein